MSAREPRGLHETSPEGGMPGTPHGGHPRRAGTSLVLVAEDDSEMRKLLVHHLRAAGYAVVAVGSGHGLADRLASQLLCPGILDVDVLVTDLRMPGWSGLEVVANLRQAGWNLPVVLLTAFADRATQMEAVRLGVSRILSKPIDLREVVDAVRGVCAPQPRAA